MNNYLIPPRFYNTGFIPRTARDLRIKQGLSPQDVSNDCLVIKNKSVCNNDLLYPAKQVEISYGSSGKIPNNCPCLDYIQPP